MKKNLFKLLFVMLFLLTVSFTFVYNNNTNVLADETETEEVVKPSLNIYKKNISYASEIYIMYAVSYEGIDVTTNPVKMLFYNSVQDEYTTQTASYVTSSQGSVNIGGVSCQIFASNGLAAKQMTDDIYARAYVEINDEIIYSDVVKYSVLEYYYEIKEAGTVSTNILNLLEAMVNYGAAAQTNFNYNTEKLANATYYKVSVENAVLPDGFTSGRFKAEEQVTLTAPLKEGYVFTGWTNSSDELVSTETTYTLTVTKDETLTANYEEEVAVTPVTLTLTKEAAYDATASTLDLPSTVTFDYNNETVTENVTWDTSLFVVNKIGKQKLYGTLSNDSYKVNELSIEIDVLPYTFRLIENEYEIKKYYGSTKELKIPSQFNGFNISSIGASAFYDCDSLNKIYIPQSISVIGNNAFYHCSNLISIEISSTIKKIKDNVFTYCGNLNKVYYKGTIEEWCQIEFTTSHSNPMSINTYDSLYFLNFENNFEEVTEIIVPESITSLGNYQLNGIKNLEKIFISSSVIKIGIDCFYGCINIEEVYYDSSFVNWLEISFDNSFSNPARYGAKFYENELSEYKEVLNVEIPSYITNVNYQFTGINCIETIKIPDSILSIEKYAFANCSNLIEINIPDTITEIKESTFAGCSNLVNINLSKNIINIGNFAFENCSSLNFIDLPKCIEVIGWKSFSGCTNLENITLSDNITYIDQESFQNCKSLTYFIITKNINKIYSNAFYGCTSLKVIYNLSNLELTIGSTDNGYVAYYAKYIHNELPREIILEKEVAYDATVDTLDLPQSVTFTYNEEEITQNITWDTSTFIVNQIGEQVIHGTFSDDELYDQYNIKRGYIYITIDVLPYTFSLDEETSEYTITKYYGNETNVVIPEKFNNVKISSLSETTSVFYENEQLLSVVIPNSINFLGNAFWNCRNLKEIVLPNELKKVEDFTFWNCGEISDVYYTGTIESWCEISFYGSISDEFHFYMKDANDEWNEITEIKIPNTINSLGNYQFCGFGFVDQIIVPNSIKSIGDSVFYCCKNISLIELPSTMEYIGSNAFGSCSNLNNIIIPEGISIINNTTFSGCTNIKSIVLPQSLERIDRYPFVSCNSLIDVYYNGTIESWSNIEFFSYDSNPMYYANHFYLKDQLNEWTELLEIEIPNSVTELSYQFYGFDMVTKIVLSENLMIINGSALRECTSLIDIVIPQSLTTIGSGAFDKCTSLTNVYYEGDMESWCNISFNNNYSSNPMSYASHFYLKNESDEWAEIYEINIPSTITSLGKYQFYGFSRITSLFMSKEVNEIGTHAFYGCSSLENVYYDGNIDDWCNIIFETEWSNPMKYANNFFIKDTNENWHVIENIEISGVVTTISKYQFANFNNIKKVKIGYGVEKIDLEAFSGCTSLIEIELPSTLKTIGDWGFYNCENLISIKIPEGVENIGTRAFWCCKSLVDLEFPTTLKTIGSNCFNACDSLENLYYSGTIEAWCNFEFKDQFSTPMSYADHFFMKNENSEWNEITTLCIPETVTSIGNYQFCGFSNLLEITLPINISSLGNSCFSSCINLTNIVIPETVTSIGSSAFRNCTNLINITIPVSVTTIQEYTFAYCDKLKKIELPRLLTRIDQYAFYECKDLESLILYENINYIGKYACWNCTSLKTIYNLSNLELSIGSTDYGYVAYNAEEIYTSLPEEE